MFAWNDASSVGRCVCRAAVLLTQTFFENTWQKHITNFNENLTYIISCLIINYLGFIIIIILTKQYFKVCCMLGIPVAALASLHEFLFKIFDAVPEYLRYRIHVVLYWFNKKFLRIWSTYILYIYIYAFLTIKIIRLIFVVNWKCKMDSGVLCW